MNKVLDLEGEVWVAINHPSIGDYSNRYMVSNKGRVKSLNYNRTGKEGLIKQRKFKTGYIYVGLCRGERQPKWFQVHRLVATMFIPNSENLPCVNHKSEVKSENQASNLEWCSYKYNSNYGTGIQRNIEARKNSLAWKEGIIRGLETRKTSNAYKEGVKRGAVKRSKQVFQYTTDGKLVNIYPSVSEVARQTGYTQCCIVDCCNGNQKTAYSYVWSYVELTSNQILNLIESKIRGKQVFQYTINGVLVNTYPNTSKTAQQTGYTQSCIVDCCNGNQKTAYGYVWSYVELSSKEVLDLFESVKLGKTVYQYTTGRELVNIYPSAKEAARQTGFTDVNISACCRGEQKTSNGFLWSYSPLPNTTNQLSLFPLTETKIS